jgi:hypothetical protein
MYGGRFHIAAVIKEQHRLFFRYHRDINVLHIHTIGIGYFQSKRINIYLLLFKLIDGVVAYHTSAIAPLKSGTLVRVFGFGSHLQSYIAIAHSRTTHRNFRRQTVYDCYFGLLFHTSVISIQAEVHKEFS